MIADFVQRLLFVRQFELGNGKLEIVNTKEALVPLGFLVNLQEKDPEGFYKELKKSVKESFDKIGKAFGGETFNKSEELFNLYGFGRLKILDFDPAKKKALVQVIDTPLVKSYDSKTPSCSLVSGVLAGMFSYLLKKDVDVTVNKCMAKGNDYCEFIIK